MTKYRIKKIIEDGQTHYRVYVRRGLIYKRHRYGYFTELQDAVNKVKEEKENDVEKKERCKNDGEKWLSEEDMMLEQL